MIDGEEPSRCEAAHGGIRDEAGARALLDAVFAAVEGRVVTADACLERVVRSEATREPEGTRSFLPRAEKGGLVLRLVGEGGRRLEANLGDPTGADLGPRVAAALATLPCVAADPELALAPLPDRSTRHFGPELSEDPRDVDPTPRFVGLLDEIEALAHERAEAHGPDARVAVRVRAYVQVEEKVVADAEGLWRTQRLAHSFLQVEAAARRGDVQARYVARWGELAGWAALADAAGGLRPEPRARVRDGIERALRLLDARALSPAEAAALTHYVLDPSAMVFIHEAEGHNFEADLIRAGASGLFTRDGRPVTAQLAAPCVRLVDGPPPADRTGALRHGEGFGTSFIDDEGVEVRPVVLIDHGRPTGRLHDRETAGHFGEAPNGRGFGELGAPRLVRMTNTCLMPADERSWHAELDPFLAGISLGVWLFGSTGGQVSGEGMSSGIQSGRLIRDGRLTDEWLLPCTFTVRTRDALRTVEGFWGEPRCDRPGFCGKGGGPGQPQQIRPVSEGGCAARLAASDALRLAW